MENLLSEKDNLLLISQMINTAKNNLQKGMGNIFLLWGYLVAGISLGTLILWETLPGTSGYFAYFLWFLMIFGVPVHLGLIRKREKDRMVMTYIEKLMGWVWIGFALAIAVVVAGMLVDSVILVNYAPSHAIDRSHEFIRWFQWLLLTPFILCLYGFALFVSGKAYSFRPLVIGGKVCFIASFLLLFSLHKTGVPGFQLPVLCISAVAGFIIPGHLLNRKERRNV